jgi:TolA-binding protein
MVRLSRRFLILIALICSAGRLLGANSEEERAFGVATDKFNAHFYEPAEKDFGDFAQKYPNSIHLPEAILYRAQAKIYLGQFSSAISLLSTNQAHAGQLAPLFLFSTARAHFENGDYARAATSFGDFVAKYPKSKQSLDALVREGAAYARLEQWPRVIELLEDTNGVFQQTVSAGAASETIAAGYLLLGEAQLAQGHLDRVGGILELLGKQPLTTDLKWQQQYLAARQQRAEGHLDDAFVTSASLLASANATNRAQGVAFQAGVLEQMGKLDEAVNAYTSNLSTNAPPDQQRFSILKIAELDLKQEKKLPDAVEKLEGFRAGFPNSPAADLAELTLGEVRLQQALAASATNAPGGTNFYGLALDRFDFLLNTWSNSPLAGKALLDKGWCLWGQQKIADSLAAFRDAAGRLSFSGEQAQARFKWADAQFQLKDFAGAITNYNYVAVNYANVPEVTDQGLIERALYQAGRAALAGNNRPAAAGAVQNILTWFPNGFAGPSMLLLTGQGLAEQNEPAAARKFFEQFEQLYPGNELLADVRLAVARSYEQEGKWNEAVTNYTDWTAAFPNHHLLPQAKFNLAWDNYMGGNETNALMLFTNFIAQFPTNELSARAQWWVGDYYFRQPDFLAAEKNYQLVFQNTNWAFADLSNLTAKARMMAGRSAMARFRYDEAIGYFTNLLSRDYPAELQVEATFAFVDATIGRADSTNKAVYLDAAIQSLKTIPQTQSNSWAAAQAWGKIGDCHFDWGSIDSSHYADAAAAYRTVVDYPQATSAAKNEARFMLGEVLKKQAELKTGDEQTALLKQALDQYVDAFYQGWRDPEKPAPLWTKKAGLAAAQLAESLQQWQSVYCVYAQLKTLLPVMAPVCDKKMDKAMDHGANADCKF